MAITMPDGSQHEYGPGSVQVQVILVQVSGDQQHTMQGKLCPGLSTIQVMIHHHRLGITGMPHVLPRGIPCGLDANQLPILAVLRFLPCSLSTVDPSFYDST